jgi:hypothetical protein
MTPESVFSLYRAYKFYYSGKHLDFDRYINIRIPPLIQQRERQFYYRIAQRLNDTTVHALFTVGFFFAPKAHVTALATPDAFSAALSFAGRTENGDTLLQHDLYELKKRLTDNTAGSNYFGVDLAAWLYGEPGELIPTCVQDIINGDLPLDVACMLLLVPQPSMSYNWPVAMAAHPDDAGLGASPWIDRLKKVDQLLRLHRPLWRQTAHRLSKEFWHSLASPSLAPPTTPQPESALF